MARLFAPIMGTGLFGRNRETFAPQLDVEERDNEYVLRVDLPGVKDKDVHVTMDDHVLTVTGERRRDETKRGRGYEYAERDYGYFTRSVELPRSADTAQVEADLRNGVLEVHIRKAESAQARQIPIGRSERGSMEGAKEEPRVLEAGNGGRAKKSEGSLNASG